MPQILSKKSETFSIRSSAEAKQQFFRWAQSFDPVCYLDSNEYGKQHENGIEGLLAVGQQKEICISSTVTNPFEQLRQFQQKTKDWIFGFLTYDLKNSIEKLSSNNEDHLDFPDLHFFQPIYLIKFFPNKIEITSSAETPVAIWKSILETKKEKTDSTQLNINQLQSRISRADYLQTIEKIKYHLHVGDIYEMNFCQEFFIKNITFPPATLFEKLNQISKAPFSAFYRRKDQYLLCASPERFLKKEGQQLTSQPIKGTIKKGKTTAENNRLIESLKRSRKDRSEHVMIVDLVRNDLSRTCIPGSVKVSELYGSYQFPQVNHLISTITGTLRPELDGIDAIKNAFPMGSMTGAPKIRSMQLIEQYEHSKRGLYSGAVGYFTPEEDFDFNVVIRSMLYNESKKYLSFQVGGAIVNDSVPEKEYEECLLKAAGILKALGA